MTVLILFSPLVFGMSADFPNSGLFFSQLECRSNGQSTIYLSGTIKSGNEEERLDQTVPISRVQCAGILAKVVNFNQCGEGTLNFGRFTVKKTISSYYGFASTSYAVGDVDLTQFEGMGTTGRCLR